VIWKDDGGSGLGVAAKMQGSRGVLLVWKYERDGGNVPGGENSLQRTRRDRGV
jgi:hypothetical protein